LGLLINHLHKWAFIHIPKTGGTSITNSILDIPETEVLTSHDTIRLLENSSDYFVFTMVRNPYTRFMSAYYANCRKGGYETLENYIKNFNENETWNLPQNHYILSGKTKSRKVNFIGRYENYTNDVSYIFEKLEVNKKIPHLNRNPIYDKHPELNQESFYKHMYQEEWIKDWVRERYLNDFKIFNYGMDI